ncbi:phosphoglycolate phosphatase [Pseudochrobactrum sp. MP213Fo]|uniref:phosphoglycolate phosphatase n=1 Tax=Pseudochrobactrum sp. MP213Fo TaxID=3022250 RepID=UPI003BA1CE10
MSDISVHTTASTPTGKPIVVFDLDGTLVDTAPDLLDSLNHCLIAGGLTPADPAALRKFVGSGAKVMIERAYQAQNKHLSDEQMQKLFKLFMEHYNGNMPGSSAFYPGVLACLDALKQAGYILAVCTNKFEVSAKKLLEGLGEAQRFAVICGQDTFPYRKPDPRHLTDTIKLAGGNPLQAVMVGDSRADIDAAKAAGIPVIAVDFGYTDLHVSHFEPSRIISHFNALTTDMVAELMSAAKQAAE